jgi:hypothetical protein
MPLPNGLPDWLFPGTLLRRIEDGSLWTVIEVSTRRGAAPGDLTVAVESATPLLAISGDHLYPVAMMLTTFRPAGEPERAVYVGGYGAAWRNDGGVESPSAFVRIDGGSPDTFDVYFVGSDNVERVPRRQVSFSVMPHQSRHIITQGFRRFQIGDLFHIQELDVFLGVIGHESISFVGAPVGFMRAPTEQQIVTFAHERLPDAFDIDFETLTFVTPRLTSLGFPAPPLEGDVVGPPASPFTQVPLIGFELCRPQIPEPPIVRRSAYDRLLDEDDPDLAD